MQNIMQYYIMVAFFPSFLFVPHIASRIFFSAMNKKRTLMAIVRALLYNISIPHARNSKTDNFLFALTLACYFFFVVSSFAIGCCLQLEHSNEYTIYIQVYSLYYFNHRTRKTNKNNSTFFWPPLDISVPS